MFSFQMTVTQPFTSEEAQSTYQTSATEAIKTLTVATQYYTNTSATPYITQGTVSMVAPVTGGASAMTVLGAVSLALLTAAF